MSEAPSFLHDDVDRLPASVLVPGTAQLERLGKEQDLRERGAKLVRDTRGEIRAEPNEVLLTAELTGGDDGESGRERQQTEQNREPRCRSGHDQSAGDGGGKSDPHHQRPHGRHSLERPLPGGWTGAENQRVRLERPHRRSRASRSSRRPSPTAAATGVGPAHPERPA